MREGVVERRARGEAVEHDGEHKDAKRRVLGGDEREAEHGGREARQADDGGRPKSAVAADVQPADDEAAGAEADVGGDEDGARDSRGVAADGEDEDGGVVEQGPADGHEEELGGAGEQDAPGGEDRDWDDGVCDDFEFDHDEEKEGNG